MASPWLACRVDGSRTVQTLRRRRGAQGALWGLLCIRKRKLVVTTNSDHGCKIYPNLTGKMTPTGVDQLWVADITYVRLHLRTRSTSTS